MQFDEQYFSSFWRKSYKRRFHPFYDFRVWFITRFLKPTSILDVGCGTGLIVLKLRKKRINAYGMDISKNAILKAPKHLRKYFFVGNIKKMPIISKSFDTVSCIDVLEHVKKEDIAKAIKECSRIAKHSIYFDITCLEDILFIFSDSTHVSKFFSWEWHTILEKTLGNEWDITRGPIFPFVHHGIFIAKRKFK